jgi:adenylate cyclase
MLVDDKGPGQKPGADAQFSQDMDVVGQIIGTRLQQGDIRKILATLQADDREHFTEKLADILRKTSALLEVSKRVSDTLSLDILLPRMVQIVSEFLNSERCTLFLYDAQNQELYSRLAQGDLTQEIRIPAHVGIAGAVFKSGQSLIIPDAYADDRFNPDVDKKTGYQTRNILCAPIRTTKGEIIGVAQVLNKRLEAFSQDDLQLLESITSHAAAAFVNAQLHEQITRAQQEEAKLLEVTTVISKELQLEPLLRKIMETVTTILHADRSTLFMYDPKRKELWSTVAQGVGVVQIRIPATAGIAGSVFSRGETVNIPDAYADTRFNKDVDKRTGYKTDSILCMPVINKREETIGVIQVLNKRGGPFTATDERRLRAFASQASIAIENAKLFEDVVNMKNYNESILHSMSNGVISLDAERVIVTANSAALRVWRCENDPGKVIGQKADGFFFGKNAWVCESMDKVDKTGKIVTALDTDMWLRQDPDPTAEERRRSVASVNLSVVPLVGAKKENLGCMVMFEDITKEKRLKGTMARYMTKELADKLLEEGEAVLGGKMQKATVVFTDIRSFTSISERLGAQETVKMLNEYFSIMVDVIMANGGILDKYIGDAIMAVFGAPFAGEEDADHAVRTAIGMLQELRAFNQRRAAEGQDPVHMGVGVNTDDVLSGNIGSLKRMDYTVIGDGVNLASRLEGANKPYGTQVLISEFTVRALKHAYQLREVDKIRVKGKNEPVGVFEVLDHLDASEFPQRAETLGKFQEGLAHYRRRDWFKAGQVFDQIMAFNPKDTVSKLYSDRCKYFYAYPPPEDWDGVWVMKDK